MIHLGRLCDCCVMSLCTRWPAFCFKSILSRVCCCFRERGRKKSPPVHHKWETTFQFWNLWWTECRRKVFCGINAFLKFVFPPQRLQSQRLQTKHFSVAVIILPSRSYSNIPFGFFSSFLFFRGRSYSGTSMLEIWRVDRLHCDWHTHQNENPSCLGELWYLSNCGYLLMFLSQMHVRANAKS